jgi:hypothetical protein
MLLKSFVKFVFCVNHPVCSVVSITGGGGGLIIGSPIETGLSSLHEESINAIAVHKI